jgi:hypothetical protein
MLQDVEFFFALLSLYVRCQHVNGGRKTLPFCPIQIEVILKMKTKHFFSIYLRQWKQKLLYADICSSVYL